MSTQISQLAGQTAIYGLSSIIGRLLNYLLVPLYTRVFLTGEFGVIVEMYSYVAFLIVLLTYGMETALFRFYQTEKEDRDKVFGTSVTSIITSSILFIIFVIIFRNNLAELLRYPQHAEYVVWFAIIIGFDAITAIPFAKLRAENKPVKFAVIKLINIGINIGLNLFFLLLCPWIAENGSDFSKSLINTIYNPSVGVGYVFIANLIASVITLLLLLPSIISSKLKLSVPLLKKMLVYALPLLIAGLAGVANEALDKLLLKFILPEDIAMQHVGIYGACFKIAIIMAIFIQAFRFAAEPFFFSNSEKKEAPELYANVMKYFVFACLVIFLGIMLFMDVVQHFIGREYREGLDVVPVLLMGKMFLGIYFNLSIWYKITGQTKYGAIFTIVGAAITIGLNIWLIPIYGYFGSAWVQLICYFSMTVMCLYFGQKYFKVPYPWGKIFFMIALALIIYFASTQINISLSLISHFVNTILLVSFLVIAVASDKSFSQDFKTIKKRLFGSRRSV
ncbi:MAG: polysaccharide biosynthesis C-terminal domain-containing protein [Bacteroidetes bacterium]|nr:polysaccharide biosynthesis C-terminal domain-containing protein [Bacteroidota bacterium]